MLVDLALVIVEATGRRIGSVRQLEWPDLDLTSARIRWRAAADKKRKEWWTPITPVLVDEVKRARAAIADLAGLQAVNGGPVFFATTDHSRSVDRDTLNSWLEKAEKRAKLDRLEVGCGTRTAVSGRRSGSIIRSKTSLQLVAGKTSTHCSRATRQRTTRRCSR